MTVIFNRLFIYIFYYVGRLHRFMQFLATVFDF